MELASLSWCISVVVALLCGIPWPQTHSALAPENEVPLRPTAWLLEGRVSTITLPKGRTRRLYFVLKKKVAMMSVTVSPCDLPVEWSLAARSLKDKPLKSLEWSAKKSMPEVWWRGHGTEEKIHSYAGNAMDTYTGPPYATASIYILRLRSKEQDTRVTLYLQEGPGASGAFPLLPADPRLHTLGVGMTSITLSWAHSPSLTRLPTHTQKSYDYCVLANAKHNYPSLCAARKGITKEREKDQKRERKRKQKERKETAWPILKDWWWRQWDAYSEPQNPPASPTDEYHDLQCVCRGTENVCTVSELLPDTQYYFDVFVIDRLNGTSAAYTGTFARTHEEARPAVVPLREGELRWVTFRDGASTSEQLFSFRPRGPQQSGLLTLQSCGGGQKVKVTISSKGQVLTSQVVGENLAQIWLQGSPTYLIHLERQGPTKAQASDTGLPEALRASVKMQTSSAYHRRMVPSLPSTLQIKSFNRLRSCNTVTLAWMGTEERSLYCVYRRQLGKGEGETEGAYAPTAPCLGPESRSDTERVLCKYFQELNPRRAVTTAVLGGLEPGMAYVFDVYLMRRWGIPVKYASKMVRTRREC